MHACMFRLLLTQPSSIGGWSATRSCSFPHTCRLKLSSDAARAEYETLKTSFKGVGDLSLAQVRYMHRKMWTSSYHSHAHDMRFVHVLLHMAMTALSALCTLSP